jgi:DNA-binding response OmpR family regulator
MEDRELLTNNISVVPGFSPPSDESELGQRARFTAAHDARSFGSLAAKILILDHDRQVARVVRQVLLDAGHHIALTKDAEMGAVIEQFAPACIVLGIYADNCEIALNRIAETRSRIQAPIVVVSQACYENTIVHAFECGADDYVCTPFGTREFVARINAWLRRTAQEPSTRYLRVGNLQIDRGARSALLNGDELQLTNKEFDILVCLALNPGVMVSNEAILSVVWGARFVHYVQTLRVHVSNLRKKMRAISASYDFIRSGAGNGYVLVSPLASSPSVLPAHCSPAGSHASLAHTRVSRMILNPARQGAVVNP